MRLNNLVHGWLTVRTGYLWGVGGLHSPTPHRYTFATENPDDPTILKAESQVEENIISAQHSTTVPDRCLQRFDQRLQTSPWPTGPFAIQILQLYARATWQSFTALAYPNGLPADWISAGGERARTTTPTNIGAYLWSTLAARELQIITPEDARARISQTLETLGKLERHTASGQFYNWYDAQTAECLTHWPPSGSTVYPFLSSVDNGWLAVALVMVKNAIGELRSQAASLLEGFDFGFFYDPQTGLLRGGYWPKPPPQVKAPGGFTCHRYGTLNTEPRITSYLTIAWDQAPASHYFKMQRARPSGNGRVRQERITDVCRTYLGVKVYAGYCI